jgi:hypothetical protein
MVTINCWRGVPKITITKPIVSSLFSKRGSLVVTVAAASFSSMSYDKELAAARKAASLAARLCQASLSLSLALAFLSCMPCPLHVCTSVNAPKEARKVSPFVLSFRLYWENSEFEDGGNVILGETEKLK